MSKPRQQVLPLGAMLSPTLDNFVVGRNSELLASLAGVLTPALRQTCIWLQGPPGSGRTHLLQAVCNAATAAGQEALYVHDHTLLTADEWHRAANAIRVLALDDVAAWVGKVDVETRVMAIYQRMLTEGGVLLFSAEQPARGLQFALPDLASRLHSALHYEVHPLDDAGKAQVLKQQAEHFGYHLDDAVIHYWLLRGPRDLPVLLADLVRLDRASLAQHNPITIPLLKKELGY